MRTLLAALAATLSVGGSPALAADLDPLVVAAVEATAYDYVDGQLEGDAARVARALHPDVAKRAVRASPDETLGLRRMSKDEMLDLTRRRVLKTPRENWDRSVKVLDIADGVAVARVETPWFVDYLDLGRFGDRWVIVNALWQSKPAKPVS